MDKNVKNAVCAPNGKPITFTDDEGWLAKRTADLIREYLDQNYSNVHGNLPNGDIGYYLAPADPMREYHLSIPERAAIEALAWYCREYTEGLRRNTPVTLPKLIHYEDDYEVINTGASLTFDDEARAYMLADVVERCFYCKAQVAETPAGWTVVVTDSEDRLNAETLTRLQGACRVLIDYTVEAAEECSASSNPEFIRRVPSPAAREAWQDRKAAQANRIEAGINAILARLESTPNNAPPEAAHRV